jgi:hypothetical protein
MNSPTHFFSPPSTPSRAPFLFCRYHYLILKIDGSNVNVEKSAPSDAPFSYDAFARDIKGVDEAAGSPQGHLEPRFGILDFKFDTPNGQRSKICCIAWVHPSAKVALKMKYSSTIQTLKNTLLGVHIHHQANDDSDLSESELKDKASKSA